MPAAVYPQPFSEVNRRLNYAQGMLNDIKRTLRDGAIPGKADVAEVASHFAAIGKLLDGYDAKKAAKAQ